MAYCRSVADQAALPDGKTGMLRYAYWIKGFLWSWRQEIISVDDRRCVWRGRPSGLRGLWQHWDVDLYDLSVEHGRRIGRASVDRSGPTFRVTTRDLEGELIARTSWGAPSPFQVLELRRGWEVARHYEPRCSPDDKGLSFAVSSNGKMVAEIYRAWKLPRRSLFDVWGRRILARIDMIRAAKEDELVLLLFALTFAYDVYPSTDSC